MKQEENPAALGLLEAKRKRKHAAGPSAAKRSSQVRTENCPLGLATRRSRVTVTPAVTTERWGRKPGGYKRPRGKVIESRGSPTALSNFAAKGSKGTRGQPVEEVESQGVFVLFCFPFKWEMWHVCVVVE